MLHGCQADVASAPAAEQPKVGPKQSFQNLYTVVEQEEEHQDVSILNIQTCAISTTTVLEVWPPVTTGC